MRISLLSDPPINASILCPVDMSAFISMLHSVNYFFCLWKEILIAGIVGIMIAGSVGVVFCMFLKPSVLLMPPLYLSCKCVPLPAFLLMCTSLLFVPSLIYRSIDRSINQLIGEYWCLGFEIDTTCPRHRRFVSINWRPCSTLIDRSFNQWMKKLTLFLFAPSICTSFENASLFVPASKFQNSISKSTDMKNVGFSGFSSWLSINPIPLCPT